jgi:hypothetical protein
MTAAGDEELATPEEEALFDRNRDLAFGVSR